ncbi:MAG: 16S rRNA (adenine(1518)-N(6)/adenine(1519)-N(6))-dimethyltransferase RsmA [Candidatus Aceula lacicola]|nr:16S rRNA (adenine(1518)-N(6)/adenine(1519)-N(6))-dimethyltransferase RsmA [Candidatus Aceula lacicola]
MKKESQSSIRPKKRLGQNFLTDLNVVDKIILACDLKKTDCVLEVGSGLGALTKKIAPNVKMLVAIEKDHSLIEELSKKSFGPHVTLCNDDILKFDFLKLNKEIKLIGNLPYYISSPIIEKLIENSNRISSAFITVQLEFANRLVAKPNTKEYGSLTCFVQYHATPTLLFKIKNSCFRPIPKVQSAFVRLDFKKNPSPKAKNEDLLFETIRRAFQQRRKTILNSLSTKYKKSQIENVLKNCNINPKSRAENLTLDNFVSIANHFAKL